MPTPLLEARGLVKHFGHVEALRGADFDVHAGEIVALVGDNGAGKSTLVKALSGVQSPDSGSITLEGQRIDHLNAERTRAMGIETVYQDLALAPTLSAVENLYLGRERRRAGVLGALGFIDKGAMRRGSKEIFSELGVAIQDAASPIAGMSGGQRQGVAVCRAAAWASKVIFLDEPTAALGVVQTRNVLDLVRRIRDRGVGVVLISHNMPDVLEVADRVQVLRLGRRVATFERAGLTMERIVAAMTGALSASEER
ncbi:ATP-binding cassette domain-containing protein [Ruicaihuangia caeni]|uniref:ATP-binding cassette domain-containing protein n=1 Tax=Ruicaihuangia caeni TaxID=3042517 RepID=A0AAW6T9Z7_9MICO|nr:ATP-binding cassette domain-containing protein [Klugiella sp. YN-L-19]MDI2099199.1 ATP-binding cassette domain-containing protein [Klugiella sp. YN-L-19]